MRLPDIPAIAIGAAGLFCLVQGVGLPADSTLAAGNGIIAAFLEGIEKYATVSTVCLYIAAGAMLLSGILRIWVENSTARWLWGVGSAALAALLMIMLNETLFAWAWTSSLYDTGTAEVVLTVFHFCWMIACPFAALYAAMAVGDGSVALPGSICEKAMPFWAIPVCALAGFLASLVPYVALLLVMIPLNYLFAVVDAIFIVLAFIVIFLLLKLGVI